MQIKIGDCFLLNSGNVWRVRALTYNALGYDLLERIGYINDDGEYIPHVGTQLEVQRVWIKSGVRSGVLTRVEIGNDFHVYRKEY